MQRFSLKTSAEIGALIRARRRAMKLTQAQLAEIVGVSRLWINQAERGKPGAGMGLVLRTLVVVGVNLSWSVPGDDRNPEGPRPPSDIDRILEDARGKKHTMSKAIASDNGSD